MFEIVVIGGGPAGVMAALRASELGASVGLVERGNLGGTCLGDGCVPTRVLAHAARLVRDAEQFADYGLEGEAPQVDFERLMNRTQRIVYEVQEKKQLRARLESAGVEVFERVGDARFVEEHTLLLGDGSSVSGDKFIVCAGGHARCPAFPGAELAMTHSDVWRLKQRPRSVAVVGAAATGCQLASVFSAFGSQVRLLELAPRLLAAEDDAVSQGVAAAFHRRGIEVEAGISGIERIEQHGGMLVLWYSAGGKALSLRVEAVVLAVGWPGNVEALNLEATGAEIERGYVRVDDSLRTSASHVFAAGDVTGRMMLVQSATFEGRFASERAVLGDAPSCSHEIVAHGGFTDPEYASVGLTERQAHQMHEEHTCIVAVVPYADLDRGVIDGRPEGLCKLVVDRPSRRILGAHIVGEQAVEVVQIVATAMQADMTVELLADVKLAYPTFTAIVGMAARRALRQLGVDATTPRQGISGEAERSDWEYRLR